MSTYLVTWSSDIKANVTNELPDPENPTNNTAVQSEKGVSS